MNLISKRIGIDDHFPIDKYSKAMFPNNEIYDDVISNEPLKYGQCMKNVYRSDEWIKAWIKHEWNKQIDKEHAYYVYNIDYDGIGKPVKKYVENNDVEILYKRANGVMYYDFDNIDKETINIIKDAYKFVSMKEHAFQWFEVSSSGKGCHIRLKYKLKYKNKIEWQFIYMYFLDALLKKISESIDISEWFNNGVLDWSCASVTRGFVMPYNENGVIENEHYEEDYNLPYKSLKDLNILINAYCFGAWNKEIRDKFLHNIGQHKNINDKRFVSHYEIDKVNINEMQMQSGEKFNYNWRLKCVTTLMNLYDYDKDKVRNACKLIYSFITPYKNHTYEEMIGYELENKIFANGNMELSPSQDIINDLEKYFCFIIRRKRKTNEVYISDMLQNL